MTRTDRPADPAPRRRDAAATRRQLLEAARARFARDGYDATTVRAVAGDVGVDPALVKRYFGSKEGLFKTCLADDPRTPSAGAPLPGRRAELARALAERLTADLWPEFDDHPVGLLLRTAADPGDAARRAQALEAFAGHLVQVTGTRDDDEGRLRASLVLALGVGVAALRRTAGPRALREADADALRAPLEDLLRAVLPEG